MMTVGQIITAVTDQCTGISGVESFAIQNWIDRAHKVIHDRLLLAEALNSTAETFTWATADGATKDVGTSALTRWRAEPYWVSGTSETGVPWTRVRLLDMRNRQIGGAARPYIDGGFAYAVQGNYMLIAEAPGSDVTVSVIHYQYPADLDDYTDSPVLPNGFDEMLVKAGERDVWNYAALMEPGATSKRELKNRAAEAAIEYERLYKKLVAHVSMESGAVSRMEPGPIARGAAMQEMKRRAY